MTAIMKIYTIAEMKNKQPTLKYNPLSLKHMISSLTEKSCKG